MDFTVIRRVVLGVVLLVSPVWADQGQTNAPTYIDISLKAFIGELVKRNMDVYYADLQDRINKHKIEVEKGIFSPRFSASLKHDLTHVPNSAEEELTRFSQPEYREKRNTANLGVKGTNSYGTQWDIRYRFYGKGSSIIDEYKDYRREYSGNLDLTIRQPLLKGFGKDVNLSQVRIAEVNRKISQEEYKVTLMELIALGVKYYWELYSAERLYDSWSRSLSVAEEQLRIAEVEAANGVIPETEVLYIKSSLSDRKDELYSMQLNIINIHQKVFSLLNLSSLANKNILFRATDSIDSESISVPDMDKPIEQVVKRWPQFGVVSQKLEKVSIERKSLENDLLPQLDVIANANLSGLNKDDTKAFNQSFGSDFTSQYVGLEFSMPMDGWKTEKNRLAINKLEERKLKAEEATLLRNVSNELAAKKSEMMVLKEQAAKNKENYQLEQKLLANVKTQFDYGAINIDELFQREDRLISSERSLLNSFYRLRLSEIEVNKNFGVLLDMFKVNISNLGSGKIRDFSGESFRSDVAK